jgi:hypothetical protein
MRAAFGKVNTMHNHVLPWADRPLVTDNLLGGEDGINDAGISVTRIIPAPKGLYVEGTGQLFRGDSGDSRHPLFTASHKSDVSAVAHLRGYKDITEATNLDLGVSFARGHNDGLPAPNNAGVPVTTSLLGITPNPFVPLTGLTGTILATPVAALPGSAPTLPGSFLNADLLTHIYGADATLRWKPLRRSIYHSFIGRTEFVWSQRQQIPGLKLVPVTTSGPGGTRLLTTTLQPLPPETVRSFGYYASADYQLGRRWFVGGRWDWSERAQRAVADHGASVLLTYWPSEFSQIRGQYRFTHFAEGLDANELLMQVIFVLGAHGAHPF